MVILISLLIFALPLLVLPVGVSMFEAPKVIAGEILIEVLLVWALLKNRLNLSFFKSYAGLGFGLLVALSLIDLVFFKTNSTFFGNAFRLQGVFLLWHLPALAVVSSAISLPKRIYSPATFSLVSVALSVYILGGDLNGRAFGTLGEANSLAGMAVFLLPFGLLGSPRWAKIVSLLTTGLIILASGSRAGVIALLIQLIFVGFVFLAHLRPSRAFLVALLLSLASLALPIYAGGGWYENRSEIWYTSLVAGSLSPIIGYGFGNTEIALHKTALILNNNIQYQIVDSAHNIFLDFWVQGGALGVMGLVILIVSAIRSFLQKNQLQELLIVLGLLITLSFNPVSVSLLIAFWFLLGQGFKKVYN